MGNETIHEQESLEDRLNRSRILLRSKADEALRVVSSMVSEDSDGITVVSATRMGILFPQLAVEALQLLNMLDESDGVTPQQAQTSDNPAEIN